jgi:hypothetical protein
MCQSVSLGAVVGRSWSRRTFLELGWCRSCRRRVGVGAAGRSCSCLRSFMVELLLVGLCGFGWSLSCCRSNLAAVAIGRSKEPSLSVGRGAVAVGWSRSRRVSCSWSSCRRLVLEPLLSVGCGAVADGRSYSRCSLLVVKLSQLVGLGAVAVEAVGDGWCWSCRRNGLLRTSSDESRV